MEANAMAGETSKGSTGRMGEAGAGPVPPSGGDPQFARADGDAPVRACIAAIPGRRGP